MPNIRAPVFIAPLIAVVVSIGSPPAFAVTSDAKANYRAGVIASEVDRLAEEHNAAPLGEPAAEGCRWVTQTVSYQGASQTRRVRVCGKPQSWWRRWIWAGRGG
jgi:hypothetical protein